jgi:WhiB family redox-sensing transcriptional regulator
VYEPTGWRDRAACRFEDPEIFFPVGHARMGQLQTEVAKRVCARCPVREPCLASALQVGVDEGVWGGLSTDERRALRRVVVPAARAAHDGMRSGTCVS